jgi:hypothetical protein
MRANARVEDISSLGDLAQHTTEGFAYLTYVVRLGIESDVYGHDSTLNAAAIRAGTLEHQASVRLERMVRVHQVLGFDAQGEPELVTTMVETNVLEEIRNGVNSLFAALRTI